MTVPIPYVEHERVISDLNTIRISRIENDAVRIGGAVQIDSGVSRVREVRRRDSDKLR